MQIGFIGLGSMGSAMALNLVKAGHEVRAWNRSRIVQDRVPGITLVPVAADAFQADAVFTMLSDDPAIREVILDAGLLAKARPGLTHVITSTISVALARELEVLHEKVALGYVSAPVLGRPNVAASGQLNILAAGKADAVAAIEPLLASIGKRVWKLGEDPARANAAKIACNMMIAMAIEAMAEGVVLTESVGLDRADFFELILGTLFSGRAYESYSAQITDRSFEPGFKAKLALKDMRLAVEAGNQIGRTLPMLEAVREGLANAVSAGLGEKDWSIMADMTVRNIATATDSGER
ncbi:MULTISPECIES: NAD(P)-dependent oxidoreductase [Methylobacterium]|jgi:3-hydroxyisobutyrate dehydrogenase-like beta-hydroxyacid dehydrogenase|uniref:6-phosphogluconate dehydrogenase NAD-binding n=1 Tax=Methylobacterium radiotolerans (strain ATCC 27329 / DSM 1819 / JCM 2831 / NBRC 15690 / NCIMB 10815 / 0-1) TaxID=426355 RepID=B1M808_METRJ|nr:MULTISPECIES: NAD(P)-dependent oxidoreductase [Methylobacterium]GAN47642.1 NAD-binding 6-phosphogluconate dehydrogenase [Methylobacterium sp. ME121]ACB26729.1 6-phosphogluconate dehydrogenase NAD-binding [Methylobacterium radiotolerans JCM 2831]KIU28784.1 oxidoreductase [Methylobacterium radiotolerans]KTS04229.1 oxidoreductase [Methylobacterium radiotolerans]KTS50573.1 oxidoreductase [Methylobacterium radiotolerans]